MFWRQLVLGCAHVCVCVLSCALSLSLSCVSLGFLMNPAPVYCPTETERRLGWRYNYGKLAFNLRCSWLP